MCVTALVALAIAYTCQQCGAPTFVTCIVCLIAICLTWSALILCLRRTVVSITRDHVEIRRAYLGAGRSRTIPRSQISDVKTKVTMSSNATAYHGIELQLDNGNSASIGGLIRGNRDADWLAAEILAAIADRP